MSDEAPEVARRRPAVLRLLEHLPVILLLIVASHQIVRSQTGHLDPWKGGGFGMFASTDGGRARYLRVFIEGLPETLEVHLEGSIGELELRAKTLPTDRNLEAVAEQALARVGDEVAPITAVRVEVWVTRFDPETLKPTPELLASHRLGLAP